MQATPGLNRRHVRRRFDRAADAFDDADFVHSVTRQGILRRLEPRRREAATIRDRGAATGSAPPLLKKRFTRARIISVDLSLNMLRRCAAKRRRWSRPREVQADAARLPFAAGSVDLAFANLLLPWIDDPPRVFAEVARVLREGGVFAFASLGPDSLAALRAAWASVDGGVHVSPFVDMHDVGDALLHAGLADPVLDVDRLDVRYGDAGALLRDLTASGSRNAARGRRKTLTGKARFARMVDALTAGGTGNGIEIEMEIVYGHCWGRGARARRGDVGIDPAAIPVRRRGG